MTTIVSFLIVLGILIFIHELGHFVVAKYTGVGVEKFSLGFGPRLIGIKKGETEYRLSLIPFGGYVKMLGEESGEEVSEADKGKSFTHKSLFERTLIVAAGSVMNLVLAIALFPLIFMLGISVPLYLTAKPEIGYVAKAEEGSAHKAGIKKGDLIEEINGRKVSTWEEVYMAMATNLEKPLVFKIRRGDEYFEATLPVQKMDSSGFGGFGYAGIYPDMPVEVGGVTKGHPAEKAGLKSGDAIRAIDGVPVTHWLELQETIRMDGKEKTFLIEREGKTFEVKIAPAFDKESNLFVLGVVKKESMMTRSYGFLEAIGLGLEKTWELTVLLFVVLKGLLVGSVSIKALGGPIMIAQVAGSAAESGVVAVLSLIAFLSLQLGIINLFPIPVLDGGHLLFFAIEGVMGRPLSEKFLRVAQNVGMAFLLALMVLVTWNDVIRLFGG